MIDNEARTTNVHYKRVLFVNPAKDDKFIVDRIHMGFSLLGEILVKGSHEVKIIDYAFLRNLKGRIDIPSIEKIIHEFEPHVIGISVFTYLYDECVALIDRISRCCSSPIILGGPHFAIFHEDFREDNRISYIVRGEAEKVIRDLVETAERKPRPIFINCPIPSPDEIPAVNLDIAYGSQYLSVYQVQLSRGCPYHCTFCNVNIVAGRQVRARNIVTCIEQITEVKRRYPSIRTVVITDDCPTFDKTRFKRFLRLFGERNLGVDLGIDNVRANLIDEEMIQLYLSAGGKNICMGVESGHPDIFNKINKGESLDEIIKSAHLIREHGLSLGLCFVIGLPGDNLNRHAYSMRLAKKLKPDYIFWNICIPWPGSEVYQWYRTHGDIGDLRNFSTLIDPNVNFREPVAISSEFSKKDRIRAWLMANLETHGYLREPHNIWKLLSLTYRYGLYRSFAIYFVKYFLPRTAVYLKQALWRLVRR